MTGARAIYAALLRAFPAPFRGEYGEEMSRLFSEQIGQARRSRAWHAEAAVWLRALLDVVTVAPREHWHIVSQDLRVALRTMAARPGFTAVAVLSLAIGIGTNTAIFSLWNGVLHASLPGVRNPEQLVMLTNPAASGMWRGWLSFRTDGPRAWVSYEEFEQLRDRAQPAFTGLMAAQTNLSTWQARIEGTAVEPIRGRLVSGQFFEVLGVQAERGRLFTASDDKHAVPHAVISHAYWQRRFGGTADIIGRTLTLRDTPLTIVGITPAGFVGETSAQQPDIWVPLLLQPYVIPGSNWLRDTPPDKVMWLHAFARLAPGVVRAQAETHANGVFQAGLEAFYGAIEPTRRREMLDQRLQLHDAAGGASPARNTLSSSLTILLASVAVLFLIACANLANLFLARGAGRRAEIAVRLSLGASRARLVRQIVTESLTLAVLGGATSLVGSFVFHQALVRMLQEGEPDFFMDFRFAVPVAAFVVLTTMAAAALIGLLPAVQMTRTSAGGHAVGSVRGITGSGHGPRSSRWLVSVQLALSLPLLVAAGLLVRTALNLQHPDFGFAAPRLLLATVDLSEVADNTARRDRLLRSLRARLEETPGVEAASFSQLGLLSGGQSTTTISVKGSEATRGGVESALDRVGAGYFTALGIPILAGRDIADGDRRDTPRVCVINEAFARRHFSGHNPIGRQVSSLDDIDGGAAYEVVGIAGDARTHDLRSEIAPRFFVPAEQRRSQSTARTFVIRMAGELTPATVGAVRAAMKDVDPIVAITFMSSFEDHMSALTSEERSTAWLAVVFGGVALILAAIGLYGVLSFGVAQRSSELAIRIALGAQSQAVILMIVRETLWLVGAGLILGGALAVAVSQLISSRLYGLEPHDPATLALATVTLLVVALIAALLPARRAARVNPVTALHQG
jgi:predicted permease